MKEKITGTEMAYLYVCHRKLWLFHHGIKPENENINVQIGSLIQDSTFSRKEKDIPIGDIGVVDWMELQHGRIHETKKAKTSVNSDVAQTRYYLWWMRHNGMKVHTCIIHYPKQKQTKELKWDDSFDELVEKDLENARSIVAHEKPPEFEEIKYCRNCAYEMYCKADLEDVS